MEKNVPRLIKLEKIGSEDMGHIVVAEQLKNVPFKIKRIYWTFGTPTDITRGNHAHITLKQLLIPISGVIKIKLVSSKGKMYSFNLDNPSEGLFVPQMFWRTLEFREGSILLCLASEIYDENDYIRDYDLFFRSFD